ncbi:MAG: hypothetical protein MUC93_02005 [Bacteroidales bacterium]|jgi:hypothetical protein|nr:hypothetical protein [Bacteroidales bacterium]
MKKIIALLLLPILLVSFSGITSCKSGKTKESNKEQKLVEMEKIKTIEGEIESNVYPLPTSAEVIKMLTDLEVGYIFGISNPVENAKKYFSTSSKAINLGVFGADLSYATLYNIQQEVINYLDAIRSLSNELNMSKIYDETLYDRIKQNFDNRDELVKVLTSAFNDTYTYLADNDQQTMALLVVGGAWVEGMFLTTHVSEAAYQVAGISKNLLEQKKSFELFLELSKPYETDPIVSDFIKKLYPVKKVYEGLGTSLTNQNIMDLTKAIEEVRGQIVQ